MTLEWNFTFCPHHASEGLAGIRCTAKVVYIQLVELKPQSGRDPQAVEPAEEELEMAWAWLHDWGLLDDHNGRDLHLERALHRFRVLSKCQFGDTVDETAWHAFLCHLLWGQSCSCPDGLPVGLGPKVPLQSGPHQYSANMGEVTPPAPRGGSLAGCPPR